MTRPPPSPAAGTPAAPVVPALPAPVLAGFSVLVAAVAALLLLMPVQHLTGDEPRYLLYAVSAIRHGRLLMGAAEWNRLALGTAGLARPGLPVGGRNGVLMNAVYLPVLLSPVAGLFSLAGLRLASLLAGLFGLFCLLRLVRLACGPWTALGVVALAACSVPLLPYLHLFYMESFVFALVCWGWDRRDAWLLARHVAHGRSPEAARAWIEATDAPNARAVAATRERADLVVTGWTEPG